MKYWIEGSIVVDIVIKFLNTKPVYYKFHISFRDFKCKQLRIPSWLARVRESI
jgi:hypothetical protein